MVENETTLEERVKRTETPRDLFALSSEILDEAEKLLKSLVAARRSNEDRDMQQSSRVEALLDLNGKVNQKLHRAYPTLDSIIEATCTLPQEEADALQKWWVTTYLQ